METPVAADPTEGADLAVAGDAEAKPTPPTEESDGGDAADAAGDGATEE